jgi:hypothetical protein
VRVDSMQLVLRPRTAWEGCDMGVRLLQSCMKPVYLCYFVVAVPLFAVFMTTMEIAAWLPALLIWWSKPWLDRTILFVLARALFGASSTPSLLFAERRAVWGRQLLSAITVRRLSVSRSFTQPLLQLEGLEGDERRKRLKYFTARHRGIARVMTEAFLVVEQALFLSMLSLPTWFDGARVAMTFIDPMVQYPWYLSGAYALAVLLVEPFYVAAGFGMYLNRRVEIEAWDIEQEFRSAFAK